MSIINRRNKDSFDKDNNGDNDTILVNMIDNVCLIVL
jgi:hypothetical protein